MSHFSCVVIGDDPAFQLAPFHEFECTGRDDEFVQNIDRLEDVRSEYAADQAAGDFAQWIADNYGWSRVDGDAEIDLTGAHKYGWVRVRDGEVTEAVKRTNPHKQWDWWVVGGRWDSFFTLKTGHKANAAHKRDIDFAAMRREAGEMAGAEWDLMAAHRKSAGAPDEWETWDSVRDATRAAGESMDTARTRYGEQPAVKAMRAGEAEAGRFLWGSPDDFRATREDYVRAAEARAGVPFAAVKDRQWAEKGSMCWFGVVADEMPQDDWNAQYGAMIDALPDDAILTIVDCHI